MHGPLALALRADRSPPKGFWLVELALVAAVLGLDFVTGPFIQLRIAYLLPVAVAAWHAGAAAGIAIALTLSLTRFAFVAAWNMPWPVEAAVINGLISLAVLVAVVLFVQHVVYVRGLWKEVRILRGLVPICDSCGAVQGPDGHWSSLDALLMRHSEAKPVHGVCSRCCEDRAERASGGTRSF
ncbi:MAG TPA: hypothetical protein VFS11_02260 [Gemmatimonadales bacterium]|nr:hypothetical protein [Gemmatimonadales bacterium]